MFSKILHRGKIKVNTNRRYIIVKKWNIDYKGNNIRVESKWSGEKLYINEKLHDEGIGLTSRSKLIGKLPDGKLVKVCIGGSWGLHCVIFVDDEEILRA